MGLLPEQSSMIGDIHGVTVGIYKCRFLVGKMIPMKYVMIYIYAVFFFEQCRVHHILLQF